MQLRWQGAQELEITPLPVFDVPVFDVTVNPDGRADVKQTGSIPLKE